MSKELVATVDTVRTESVARQFVQKLAGYGHRASYVRRSRSIQEEPFVEWTYDVCVRYVHADEVNAAFRILGKKPNAEEKSRS